MARSVKFYTEVLDFKMAEYDADLSSPVIDLRRDGATMQLCEFDGSPALAPSPGSSRAFTARASATPSARNTAAPTGTSRGPAVTAACSATRIRSSSRITD